MSLYWRFLGAFVLLILFAVSLSAGIAYYATLNQLDTYGGSLSGKAARHVAQTLGQSYTSSEGWETLVVTIYGAGSGQVSDPRDEQEQRIEEDEERESYVLFHRGTAGEELSVFVDVGDGNVFNDDLSGLVQDQLAPEADGLITDVSDSNARRLVGYAILDFYQEFGAAESDNFVRSLLYTTTLGGLLTVAIALLLAAWFSRRIATPVTALTQAIQTTAQRGDTALLPVTSSDELGQMSIAFNKMTTDLQTQRDLRKRLLNDISHELNTPLSIIGLESHALRRGLQPPAKAADQIIQEVNLLRNLVRDLNWLAETESDELRLAVETCSIDQFLTAELARWQPQAQMNQITLSLDLPQDLPVLNLDRMRMGQALGNVIHNALQHTQVGGQVSVSATIEKEQRLVISVTDDGTGIDSTDLAHIMDRLYRADQSRSRSTGGTGLGLAIALAIVKAHSGTISVASDGLGHGTTVRIELPLLK